MGQAPQSSASDKKAAVLPLQTNRRDYRELFYTAPIGEAGISGAILFKETLFQSASDGRPFVECLLSQGVLPGVKVDEGLVPIPGNQQGETSTRGLDKLDAYCKEYRK